jgi:hypothetical protein
MGAELFGIKHNYYATRLTAADIMTSGGIAPESSVPFEILYILLVLFGRGQG